MLDKLMNILVMVCLILLTGGIFVAGLGHLSGKLSPQHFDWAINIAGGAGFVLLITLLVADARFNKTHTH